jgi:branched-chain amino acid transport system ATP-binding protein
MTELLKTIDLSKNFGGLSAVEGVDLSIDEAEKAVGIIGPNGSGKTTFFNMLTGFFLPSRGQILFQGEDITRFAPNRRVLKGIARTFQLVSVFDRLTPWENLVLSSIRFEQEHQSLFRFMLKSARNRSTLDVCFDMLALMGLEKVAETKTSELSYGSKRMLEIGIALSLKPKLLLLDEPLAGLSDFEIVEVVDVLKKIKCRLNLVIIEHKLSKILELVDRFVVLNEGRIICEGDPERVLCDEAVRECYWGKSEITGGAA